jgi:hypothetical protein
MPELSDLNVLEMWDLRFVIRLEEERFLASRDQLGRAGSHCRGRVSIPFDATAVQEDT